MARSRELGPAAAAGACLALAAALPLYNPDLYWHLSAGRRIAELRAIPTADWLSSSRAGAPWIDFEWLAQLVYHALYSAGGLPLLWAFKAALVLALARLAWTLIRLHAPDGPPAPAALAVWAAALLPFADLRPDLFSALGFSALLLALERDRLGRAPVPPLAVLALFALWANLHAGYPYGWALLAAYAAPALVRREKRGPRLLAALGAAAAGACLQPGGPGALAVLAAHGRDLGILSARINEWRAASPANEWHRPFFAALLLAAAAAAAYARRKRPADELLLVCAGLAVAGLRVVRLSLFFPLAAAGPAAGWARAALSPRAAKVSAGAACLLALALAAPTALRVGWGRTLVRGLGVEGAAAALEREAELLGGRAVYAHAWHWGGYLGWRLFPAYTVYGDGRYIFHDLVERSRAATASPEAWRAFVDGEKLDLVILETQGPTFGGVPYHVVFMPRERWALLYADERAALFARRSAFPRARLAEAARRGLKGG